MKLSAILAPLIAAGVPGEVILATVRAYEEQAEGGKEKARARWRKWKAKQPETNVGKRLPTTANVSKQLARGKDITSNLEITGEEKKERTRAARLPKDWVLPTEWRDEAIKAGLSPERSDSEARKMHNWSLADRNGAKLDWHATWRNWFQRAVEAKPPDKQPPPARNAGVLAQRQLKAINDAPIIETRHLNQGDTGADFAGPSLPGWLAVASGR